jgi:hypothetical protein
MKKDEAKIKMRVGTNQIDGGKNKMTSALIQHNSATT